MFGSHLSIAGGMVNALAEAKRLELDCVQVFTRNQRQWAAKPLSDADTCEWLAALREMNWTSAHKRGATVSHNSYLVNLASPDEESRKRSIALQRQEMVNCEALDIPFVVAHPGAHLGAPRPPGEPNRLEEEPNDDELAGLRRIAASLDALHGDLPGYRVVTCLETTVGSGTNLGYAFRHLQLVREMVAHPERIGFCFDTCHVTAAGYDMTTEEKATEVFARFNRACGLDRLFVFHVNDSEGAVGSRRDRHAHIGKGTCGNACFRAVVNHALQRGVPMILETPKESASDGTPWDVLNIRVLKGLKRGAEPADNALAPPARSGAGRARKAKR